MKRLLFSALIALTIFLYPISTFSKGIDLTPGQYQVSKKIASGYCEAKNDGLSIESAFDSAIQGALLEAITIGLTSEEPEDIEDQKQFYKEIFDFMIKKIKANCGFSEDELIVAENKLQETNDNLQIAWENKLAVEEQKKAFEEKTNAVKSKLKGVWDAIPCPGCDPKYQ